MTHKVCNSGTRANSVGMVPFNSLVDSDLV